MVVLTGAGVSAESGLPTFRGPDGLWRGRDPLALATPEAFAREPEAVWEFYSDRRAWLLAPDILPNAAHEALAELEDALGDALLLVTQNVDDLHQRAGSGHVRAIHGALLRTRCAACAHVFADEEPFARGRRCPQCRRAATLRPDVVWFGEVPHHLEEVYTAVSDCTHFAAIGTSGVVYPAAGLVELARSAGAQTVEINPVPSGNPAFSEVIAAPATVGVPAWCRRWRARCDEETGARGGT
ncbi:MAG: NAD-dependent deacylase [Opitutales bacterium]